MDVLTIIAATAGIISTIVAALVGLSNLIDFVQKQNEKKRAKPVQAKSEVLPVAPSALPSATLKSPDPTEPTPLGIPTPLVHSNLPVEATPLIGRHQEVAAVQTLLQRADVRLVSLLGPPGAGKSRLGLRVAATMTNEFQEGVCFVALAPIHDVNLVVPTIAQALAVKEIPFQPLIETLRNYLRDKRLLLVLDNFEQVMPAASQVAELMAAAPRLKVLVTSREVLSLSGEHEYVVPPLPLPELDRLSSLHSLEQSPAIALFAQRARAVKSDFRVTAENVKEIARLCIVLDGLPLAIELAAARIKVFTPGQMLARLEDRFQWLTSGARDLPAHQRTLISTLDWSYNLLESGEQILFRRLGVFVGGCTLEAAEAVCRGPGDAPLDILTALASLVDKSLLQRKQGMDAEPRYVMLETIREYARAKLVESNEAATIQRQLLRFCLTLAQTAEPMIKGMHREQALAQLEAEIDNLRAALEWSREEIASAEMGVQLAGVLAWFAHFGNHAAEARTWLAAALQREGQAAEFPKVALAKAHWGAGLMAMIQADYEVARTEFEASIALCRQSGDQFGLAVALRELVVVTLTRRDTSAAQRYGEESVALFREKGSKWDLALALQNLGYACHAQGQSERAIVLIEESDALFRELQDVWGIATTYMPLGIILAEKGDFAAARSRFEEAVALLQASGDKWNFGQALALLGEVLQRQGELEKALAIGGEVLRLNHDVGDKASMALGLRRLASIAQEQGQTERSVRLYAAAEANWDETGGAMYVTLTVDANPEQAMATMRARLGDQLLAAMWAEGQAMTLEQAIAYAVQTGDHDAQLRL